MPGRIISGLAHLRLAEPGCSCSTRSTSSVATTVATLPARSWKPWTRAEQPFHRPLSRTPVRSQLGDVHRDCEYGGGDPAALRDAWRSSPSLEIEREFEIMVGEMAVLLGSRASRSALVGSPR